MINNTGFIVVMAYPDTVVRPAYGEFSSKVWPFFGVGGKHAVQAGHATLLLISKEENTIQYFDFGRYITTDDYGRVRSEKADCELHMPFEAKHDSKAIFNLEEILLFLENHPEKTHGKGRMIVSVNSEIDYDKALQFIESLQNKGEVPYGAFIKGGTNCARFVTDTLIASTLNSSVKRRLKISNKFTPSPIGNVIHGGTDGNMIQVYKQKIIPYTNTSVSKEYKDCLFKKVPQVINTIGSIDPDLESYTSLNGQWLGGIGSGAWFEIEKTTKENQFRIQRKCPKGTIDVDALFEIDKSGFLIENPFQFLHGSNCEQCIIAQEQTTFFFQRLQ